jgi:SAM-dependent methyltransferase
VTGSTITGVDDDGVHVLPGGEDVVVDVLFDGRRIWSFWTARDVRDDVAAWPPMLKRFLNGTTFLSVVEHVSGDVLLGEEVTLGHGRGQIAVVDPDGRPLGIDKSNRITTTFDTRDAEQTKPLLDSTERLLVALREAGVDAFPAYGTLLGAIREQDLIGHDSDVDLAYVSRHTHPLDVARESFRLQRTLREQGFAVDRYSAAAFKVDVVEADGGVRGLDVFGGYFLDGHLYLLGEIGTPFREEWIFPLGTCTLAGRTLPAPARPEKLLEATYGPGWKVPDPAFHFETPRTTVRRLNGWFRGIRVHRNEWDRRYSRVRDQVPPLEPSPLARLVAEETPQGPGHHVVDVGCGRGGDALWFARQGTSTVGLDYSWSAARAARRVAEQEGLDLRLDWMNLHELRSVLAHGARIARLEGPVTLVAHHLIDSTDAQGLQALARLARMSLSRGGRLYADFDALRPGESYRPGGPRDAIRPKDVDAVVAVLEESGADVVERSVQEPTTSGSADDDGRPVARVVARWSTEGSTQ